MMAMMIFFTIPSKVLTGMIADLIKKERLQILMGFAVMLQAIGIMAFLSNQTLPMVYVFLILNGLGVVPIRPLLIVIRGRYFGRKAYGSIEGASVVFETPITIFAPVYSGWIYDTTGSYLTAFKLFAILAIISSIIMFFIHPPRSSAAVSDVSKFM